MDHKQKGIDYSLLMAQVCDNIPYYVFWKDKQLIFRGCNKLFARQFGYKDSRHIIGKTDDAFPWPKSLKEKYNRDDLEVIRTGKPLLDIEESQTQEDGSVKTVLVSKTPFYNANGEIDGVLGFYTDITSRKNAEKELKIAKENAEAAVNAKNEFLKNMRHDFRTPFSGLYGLAEHLWATETNRERKELLKLVFESAKILLDHLNEIFEFIQTENGVLPILEDKFELHTLVKNIIKIHRPPAEEKKIEIKYHIDSNVPNIMLGDELRTERILINLLSNSIKFTESGKVELFVNVHSHSDANITIEFKVKDTGIGIPQEKLTMIFEKFSRLTSSYASPYKGKGLGLNIVKQYVDELKGTAHVKSEENVGSEFTVLIPYLLPV